MFRSNIVASELNEITCRGNEYEDSRLSPMPGPVPEPTPTVPPKNTISRSNYSIYPKVSQSFHGGNINREAEISQLQTRFLQNENLRKEVITMTPSYFLFTRHQKLSSRKKGTLLRRTNPISDISNYLTLIETLYFELFFSCNFPCSVAH